jgi:uncharacterized membrane protein HdeD (DUF308 family)
MKKTLDLIKPIVYIITGILIIIFSKQIVEYLPYVVGSIMILVNIEAIVVDSIEKDYEHFGYKLGIIVLGIVIMTAAFDDFEAICIIWATISIINGGRSLIKSIIDIKKATVINIIGVLLALLSIVLSIFLIVDPLEHVTSHIVLLGLEIILDGSRIILRKYKNKYQLKIENDMN